MFECAFTVPLSFLTPLFMSHEGYNTKWIDFNNSKGLSAAH